MLWFCWTLGSNHVGQLNDFVFPKNKNFSLDTLVLIGELSSLQLGKSSSNARVSKTLPLKIWAPISDAFSNKQTFKFGSSCLSLIAVDNPEGEAPIFSVADYGLEADLFEALPQFLEELNKLNTIQK